MEIRRWDTGEVIISGDASLLELIQRAVKEKINLSRADLYGANLSRADLYGANLHRADLSRADLYGANLSRADLSRAYLSEAYLHEANLSRAYLSEANLSGAYLHGANLSGAENVEKALLTPFAIMPEVGMFTAFKKVNCASGKAILELLVPADAKRVNSPVGRKCRVSAARVIDAKALDGSEVKDTIFFSYNDPSFKYQVGSLAEVIDFDDDIRVECTRGIHCFITRAEAVQY